MIKSFSVLIMPLALIASGCAVVKDHGLDYQSAAVNETKLVLPEDAQAPVDKLVIPNDGKVATLTPTGDFSAPRAQMIYQSLGGADIFLSESSVNLHFDQPTTRVLATLKGYWRDNYEIELEEQTTENGATTLITAPVQLQEQGGWAALWSKITRLYPDKYQFRYVLQGHENLTEVTVSVAKAVDGEDEVWLSPVADELALRETVRSWSKIGRRSLDGSALLSEQTTIAGGGKYWVDHQRLFAMKLDSAQLSDEQAIAKLVVLPGVYLSQSEQGYSLSLVPEEKVARVGDIVDFTLPTGNGESAKLFKVKRRNLNDVDWQQRQYPVTVQRQPNGTFIQLDTSADSNPELTSFRLAYQLTQR